MKISVVGVGYVGLVAGSCLADGGNQVICIDKDKEKIDRLQLGQIPIYEPGLAEIIERNVKAHRLRFTTDLAEAVSGSIVIILTVGTPAKSDGSTDLTALLAAAKDIAGLMDGYRIIIVKSTVPVGTYQKITEILSEETSHPFDYISNPEFLKEGAAVEDFVRPDRVVIGTTNPKVVETMKQMYAPFMRKSDRLLVMDPASAEMTKYAANALLATKISFMNELSGLCDYFGADIEHVRHGVGTDSRLGPAFLFPGVGYGGSCFPKDITSILSMGQQSDTPMTIVKAVHQVNQRQRERFAKKIIDRFAGSTKAVTLAVWGLAFKAKTDDIRESPAISAIQMFLEEGMTVRAHDPAAMPNAVAELNGHIQTFDDCYEALSGADALVIFTDW
ncbi:MAG: UDP-glucose/GDP-mannose dehydrogenase family protein, partial [Planctomycetes bacterium]|nr:UDP-glucose/GDP-mannose dehydrogenase family protein [Planctomycetota bacterium]